jgi:hypothetical protein
LHACTAISSVTTNDKQLQQQKQQQPLQRGTRKASYNVSQSPITYVKRVEAALQPEAKMSRSKIQLSQRTKAKKIDTIKRTNTKPKNMLSNHELLSSLGLGKLPSPSNHHRKRLAQTQSRHSARPDDSKIFVVKLPPSQHYYSYSNGKITASVNEPNAIEEQGKKVSNKLHAHATY